MINLQNLARHSVDNQQKRLFTVHGKEKEFDFIYGVWTAHSNLALSRANVCNPKWRFFQTSQSTPRISAMAKQ